MSNLEENTPDRSPRRNRKDPDDERDPATVKKALRRDEKSPSRRSTLPTRGETLSPSGVGPSRHDDILKTIQTLLKPLTEGFKAMRAQQKKTQEQVDTLTQEDDEEPLDPAAATTNGTTNRPARVSRRAVLELERMHRRLDEFDSKIHRVTSSAPELTKALADTRRSPLTARIRRVQLHDRVRLKIEPFAGDQDPKKWLTAFNLAMTREKYDSLDERDANYCQVFVEHMTNEALVWFSNLPAETIDNFDDLTNAFLKHYSMNMTRITRNMFTVTQSKGEPLREFIERFKKATLDLDDMPDSVPLEALRNGLWYNSKFKEDLSLRPSTNLEDALHRSQNYIFLEEDKDFYAEKHGVKRSFPFAEDDSPENHWDVTEMPSQSAPSTPSRLRSTTPRMTSAIILCTVASTEELVILSTPARNSSVTSWSSTRRKTFRWKTSPTFMDLHELAKFLV
ncbi:unnamed protein product [Microthlaspi erraticum]|uniref:Retrotransposon gag domain-containing protein n=1 Tax=Microthlaspi erraticum TaxID=1685480 RepID=A0A6D2KDJ7_9BRAS|nr:unnamed protein product [Microthlaspi erraticum]